MVKPMVSAKSCEIRGGGRGGSGGGSGGGGSGGSGEPDLHLDEIAVALREELAKISDGSSRRPEELVKKSVGLSSFKIDLAVAHPNSAEGTWQVAVLLDGDGYRARKTVWDRDALPKQVLEGVMKWPRVVRVWLPEWRANPKEVTRKLVKLVEDANA